MQLKRINNKGRGSIGLLLLVIASFYPFLTFDWLTNFHNKIDIGIHQGDSGLIVSTVFSYATWYLFLFILIYLAAMLIAEFVAKSRDSVLFQIIFVSISLFMILFLKNIYLMNFSWSTQLLVIALMLFLQKFILSHKNFYISYTLILMIVLMSFLALNTIPGLTNYGFGIDPIFLSLKVADAYLTNSQLFLTIGISFSITFLLIALILTLLIYFFTKQILTMKKIQEKEKELKETRVQLVETKMYQELTTLVHDLKTPLVSVEGLISLLALKADPSSKQFTYYKKIEASIEKIKEMISEILYDQVKTKIVVTEFVQYVSSFIVLEGKNIDFSVEVEENLPQLTINKIRFARALTNVIGNSIASLGDHQGEITLSVFNKEDWLVFQVKDNGQGIDKEHLETIWNEGFTTKASSGIGLSFVKRVVENHKGYVNVQSEPWQETNIELFIPLVEREHEQVVR